MDTTISPALSSPPVYGLDRVHMASAYTHTHTPARTHREARAHTRTHTHTERVNNEWSRTNDTERTRQMAREKVAMATLSPPHTTAKAQSDSQADQWPYA